MSEQVPHEGRWGSEALPILEERWGPLVGYKWLQHGSSVLGLTILGVWMILWLRRRVATVFVGRTLSNAVRWAWWLSLPIILGAAWVIGMAVFGSFTHEWTVAHLAYRVLPPACALWGAITLVLAVAIQLARLRKPRESGGSADDTPGMRAGFADPSDQT